MKVHLFGATSSLSCASYTLRRTVEDSKEEASAEAVQTVIKNFYVDDCLKSVPTEFGSQLSARSTRLVFQRRILSD